MSATPTEAQIKLAYEIIFASEDGSASPMEAARLIRDSEARAVEAALPELAKLRRYYDSIVAHVGHDCIAKEYDQRGELLRDEANRRKDAEQALAALRERVRVLEEALKEIAQQKTRSEMEEDIGEYEAEHADWEGAYELAIKTARAALATPPMRRKPEPMQNPHIIISDSKRCLCGTYNLGGVHTPLACDDIYKAAAKLANQGIAEGLLLAVVLRELIEERG